MERLKNLHIEGGNGKKLLIDVFYKKGALLKPIIIFSHGFKGFKDWGHFNYLGEYFAKNGFVFVKFNFSHNGTTLEDPVNFGDLDAFGNNNYIKELDDLQAVIEWTLSSEELEKEIEPERLYLLGHSRGGGITILKASEEPRVKKIVTWASVSDFLNRNSPQTIERWKKEGVVYTLNGRTKQNMPLYYQFYETLINNKERLNISEATNKLEKPFLIVHGTADEAVQFSDADELYAKSKYGKLLKIEGGNHTFGIKHPFEGQISTDAKEVINQTIEFLK